MQQRHTLAELGRVHLMGIGGVGVSAVARLMLAQGVAVTGSDAKDLPVLDELRALGARIHVGYCAEELPEADTVVVSSVIKAGNPEYDAARDRGMRILHRSEGLAATMDGHHVVAVCGTHGKTTTTSLIAVMLREAGVSPSFAIGANVAGLGVNAEHGSGRIFVAEADESDASFLNYRPDTIVVTNIEADHLDHYGTDAAVHESFHQFASLLPDGGLLIACADDPGALALARRLRAERPLVRVQTYGFSDAADRRLSNSAPEAGRFACDLDWGSGESRRLSLAAPGDHNLLNAAAAFAVGLDCGLDPDLAIDGLAAFTGAARRFEFRGQAHGVTVYDDYAHHPTEVLAALRAGRAVAGEHGKVHVVFQPHLYSRTREFWAEFADALSLADTALVLAIYAAREQPLPGIQASLIAEALNTAGGLADRDDVAARIAEVARSGDVVMTIGAGDVTELGSVIVSMLESGA
ncbi:UDP-N-acetylmuramate--L-alanine ligase [Arthrobacter rhombi]|uniref:UDP-N-acetylmuramate--L-alanine ligase n=1 Tax=Arthrobacter rhombi TaxID=71253 RepID=A0A1R4GN15_9MICC|nr:UDP-N-acetylmuramate--L-alanine ligase [Arthrobacter rhombi]SJM69514.1 UDP-N-acetylmuramate--alanine ligase [Arthrobacter rhombi]